MTRMFWKLISEIFDLIGSILRTYRYKKYQEYKGFYEYSLKNAAREKERGGETPNYELLESGGWECKCGRVHPSYVGTCACGTTRDEMQEFALKEEEI